jgi:hypothetical protein
MIHSGPRFAIVEEAQCNEPACNMVGMCNILAELMTALVSALVVTL